MSIKTRVEKLETRLGIKKMFVFEIPDDMDSDAIESQFCRENAVNPDGKNLFIFIRRFGNQSQSWKFLYETALSH